MHKDMDFLDTSKDEIIGDVRNSPYYDEEFERKMAQRDPRKITWQMLHDAAECTNRNRTRSGKV